MSKWKMVRLGDVVDLLNGFAFKSENYSNNGIRVIRITNVQKGFIEDLHPQFYPIEKANRKYHLFENDLLISLTGNVGRVALISKQYLPAVLNQRVACLRIRNELCVDKNYIFSFLNSNIFENDCIVSSKGIAQKNMSTEWLKQYQIPLPPLDEQKRIAKNLDLASGIVKGYKEQLAELDKLVQSVFYEMFGDIKENGKLWNVAPFSYCAKIDTRMTTDFAKYADYPHIGIDSIEKNTGNIISCILVKDCDLKSGKYLFGDRHLIYSKIRPNLNKVAKPNFKGICSADAYPLLPTKQCNREYLAMVLRSDCFLDYILAFSNRTNIPKVNKLQLESFSLPLPPIDLQNRFASIVTEIEDQKAQIQQALTEAENLFNSLMQEYFE